MASFLIHILPRPEAGEISYFHALTLEALKRFASEAVRCSEDDHPEDAYAVYRAIGKPELSGRPFACLTAFIAETFSGRVTQRLFGEGSDLGLVLNPKTIVDRVLLFNGDVGSLGRDLLDSRISPDNVEVMSGSDSDLAAHLARLSQNSLYPQVEPRLRGIAFEARLFDGIRAENVSHLYSGIVKIHK